MEKHYQRLCSNQLHRRITRLILPTLSLFLLSTNSSAQESLTFEMSPEKTKQIIEDQNIRKLKIYPVSYREIEYRDFDTAQVLTSEYKRALEIIERYKAGYDAYVNSLKTYEDHRDDLKKIIDNIDIFINSKEKKELKEKYLIEAQSLADKNRIPEIILKSGNIHVPNKKIVIYDKIKQKGSSKNDLKSFQEYVLSINLTQPKKSDKYQTYVDFSNQLMSIKKTETGKVLSDKKSKRLAYMMTPDPIDVDVLLGKYIQLSEKYALVLADENTFVKNELVTEDKKYTTQLIETVVYYPIIKSKDNDKIYFVMSDKLIPTLQNDSNQENIISLIRKLGYKEYKDGEDYYITSKTSEIRLDAFTFNELSKNPSYITTLDNDQMKISALVQQTIPHSKTLDKYLSQYNIQKGRMPAATINAWRAATQQAQKLHNQIYKISEKYHGNYSYTLSKRSNTHDAFLDNLNASKGVLGM